MGSAHPGLSPANASSLWLPLALEAPPSAPRGPYAGLALLCAPPRPRLFPLRARRGLQTRKRVSWSRGQSVECEFRLYCLNLRLAVPLVYPRGVGAAKIPAPPLQPPPPPKFRRSFGGRGLPFGFEIREVGARSSRPLGGSAGRPSGEAGSHLGREVRRTRPSRETLALPLISRPSPRALPLPGSPPVSPRLSSLCVGK